MAGGGGQQSAAQGPNVQSGANAAALGGPLINPLMGQPAPQIRSQGLSTPFQYLEEANSPYKLGFNWDDLRNNTPQTQTAQSWVPEQGLIPQQPAVTTPTTGGGNNTTAAVPEVLQTGGNENAAAAIPSSVPAVDTLVDIPVPFQEATKNKLQDEEHGFRYQDVLDTREKMDAGETVAGFSAPPVVQGGADQATQHAALDASTQAYQDALSAVPDDGTATKEQRVAAAAANPAFNPEVANTYADKVVQVGTIPGTADQIGLSKRADNITTPDVERVSQQSQARGESARDRGATQNALGAATMLASGIGGVGGKPFQSGDNQGLDTDYMVVKNNDGTVSEVFGPEGTSFSSVEEAKKHEQENKGNAKQEKLDALTAAAKSGKASAAQINRATYKDKDVSTADRAKLMAQAQASSGPSRREQAEINARAEAARQAEAQAAAERQAHLATLSQPEQNQFKVDEALAGNDKGQLKSLIYDLRKQGSTNTGSLRDKSTSELKRIVQQAQASVPQAAPVPASAPPPQPVAQAAPTPVPVAAPAPAPAAPAPAAPTPAPAAPTPPPAQSAAQTQAAQALQSGSKGDLKSAIYALRKQGAVGGKSLRKMSTSQLRKEIERANASLNRNDGGPVVQNFNMGGGAAMLSPLQRRAEMMKQKQQQQNPNYVQGGGPQGGGQSMMKQMAGMGLKTALAGSPLAPFAGVLGGLFNEGGKVSKDKSWWNWFYGSKGGQEGSFRDQTNWGGHKKNDGGMIDNQHHVMPNKAWMAGATHMNMGGPLNPYGYNEGGSVMETPIKKVMDEQKLEQQAKAFELEQKRKQEAHNMTMQQKQQQFALAQKLKKQSATTSMKPKKPTGPLGAK